MLNVKGIRQVGPRSKLPVDPRAPAMVVTRHVYVEPEWVLGVKAGQVSRRGDRIITRCPACGRFVVHVAPLEVGRSGHPSFRRKALCPCPRCRFMWNMVDGAVVYDTDDAPWLKPPPRI